MELSKFSLQMDRMRDVFGNKAYPEERVKLIWREVKDFDGRWFESVVDRFCGEHKFAPLLPEFREEIAKERERLYLIQKKKNTKEAEEFMSLLTSDDISVICSGIRKRIQGYMNDHDWENFQKLLKGMNQ